MYAYVDRLARIFALLGGLILSALILMTCLSIAGRSLNGVLHGDLLQAAVPGLANGLIGLGIGPINGDFELVEAGMAFAIFAFLPLCQISAAHASVDIFTSRFPPRLNSFLRMVIELVFAAVLVLIAVQLSQGMLSKKNSGQTTLLLEFPVWWGYALSLTGASAAAVVGVYVASRRVLEAAMGAPALPNETGAEH